MSDSSAQSSTGSSATGTSRVKRGMAEMLKGGVIMDVVNAEQAKIEPQQGSDRHREAEEVKAGDHLEAIGRLPNDPAGRSTFEPFTDLKSRHAREP